MQIWDYEAPHGKLKENIKCHQEVVTTIEWLNSPEIHFYTSSLDKTIKLWKNYENVQTLSDHHGFYFYNILLFLKILKKSNFL